MQEDIASIRSELWERMRNKSSRDNFVAAHLSTGIAAQLLTMRESREWTQKQVGDKAGMADARISVMEKPSYDKFTISTLKRLASAFDVALIVRFVPFSQFVDWIADISPDKLDAVEFEKDALQPMDKKKEKESPVQVPQSPGPSRTGISARMGSMGRAPHQEELFPGQNPLDHPERSKAKEITPSNVSQLDDWRSKHPGVSPFSSGEPREQTAAIGAR